jgi:hypothetical protein
MMAFHSAAQMDAAAARAKHGTAAGEEAWKQSNPQGGFRLAQGPTNRALGSFERGTGPLVGHVVDAEGSVRGNLHIVEYERTAGGARLVLRYDDISSGAKRFNWVQTVDATVPSPHTGNPTLDNAHWSHGTPFYFSDAEAAAFTMGQGDTIYFLDMPHRSVPADWTAELSLVGQFQGSPHYSPLLTVSWGFSSQGTIFPVTLVEKPTPFHQNHFSW